MLQKYEKYDYRVQLMRIAACFIVIGCHVRLEPVINGGLDKELLLLHGFYDDGVAIFFMMIGFFLFAVREPFWKYVGKTFVRILVPVLILMLGVQVLEGWIMGETTLMECLCHPSVNFMDILRGVVSINFLEGTQGTPVWNMTSHLWYITTYLRIIVVLPLLRLLALDHPMSDKACRWLLGINVISMFVADAQVLCPLGIGTIGSFVIFDVPVTYVVVGYVLYQKQDVFQNSTKYRVLFLAGMVGINVLRFVLQCILFGRSLENNYFYYWNTTVSLVFSVCFTAFFLTFSKDAGYSWLKIVNYIGAKTFFIYLVHIAVYTFMDCRGLRNWVYSFTVWRASNLAAKLGYNLIYPAMVFACCLLMAVGVDAVRTLIRQGYRFCSHHGIRT